MSFHRPFCAPPATKGGRTRISSINMQIKKWAQQRTAYVIMQPERGKTETRIQIRIRARIQTEPS